MTSPTATEAPVAARAESAPRRARSGLLPRPRRVRLPARRRPLPPDPRASRSPTGRPSWPRPRRAAGPSTGRLIAYEEAPLDRAATPAARAVIRPEPIDFVSLPLRVDVRRAAGRRPPDARRPARRARRRLELQDATAYNVQFRDGRPILIDSLSFEPLEDGAPWIAYRQFCEHFLAPLALIAKPRRPPRTPPPRGSRRRPARSRGRAPAVADPAQPRPAVARPPPRPRPAPPCRRRCRGGAREAAPHRPSAARGRSREPAVDRRQAALGAGRHGVVGLRGPHELRRRRDGRKVRLVGELVEATAATRVWDLGANTGRYSRIAADGGRRVLAFDIDPAAAERNYRQLRKEGRGDILPLVMDLANPSPGIGWAGRERRSLLERAGPDTSWRWRSSTTSRSRATCPCRCCWTCSPARAVGGRGVRAQGGPDGPAPARDARGCLPGLHPRRLPGRGRRAGSRSWPSADRGERSGPVPAPAPLSGATGTARGR